MRPSLGLPVDFDQDHHVERLFEPFIQRLGLVDAGLDGPLGRGLFETGIR